MSATENYVHTCHSHLAAKLAGCNPELLKFYSLLVRTTGTNTTSADVHEAWSEWKAGIDPSHRSLIPFDDLTPEVQALDDKYRDAIRETAWALYG